MGRPTHFCKRAFTKLSTMAGTLVARCPAIIVAIKPYNIIFEKSRHSGRSHIELPDYREISLWLRILNPSPIRTDEAHSVSSTCNASAANPRGRVSNG